MRTVLPIKENTWVYKSSEVAVGVWIDGSIIYRRVYSSNSSSINLGVSYSKVVRCEAYSHCYRSGQWSDGFHLAPYISNSNFNGSTDYLNWYIAYSTIYFRATDPGSTNATYFVILEYIK